MPYTDDSDFLIEDGWVKGYEFEYAGTIREDPADNLLNIINRSKTAAERQENPRQSIIKIAQCKKCRKLSYIEDGICYYCKQAQDGNSTFKSMILGSSLCCCNFLSG